MRTISLRVDGEPDGQKRPRGFMQGGRMMFWSPKSAWRDHVTRIAFLMRPKQALEGPISLDLTFWMPRPKSRSASVYHDSRPDFDNLAKAVCDGLTKAGWWKDDARICAATVLKLYETPTERPGVAINAQEITGLYSPANPAYNNRAVTPAKP